MKPLLSIFFAFSLFTLQTQAQAKWNCGIAGAANVVAVFNGDTQSLVISGKGKMGEGSPWENLKEVIKTVKINQGVTTIGEKAFGSAWENGFYRNLETVIIANSVTNIASRAFSGANNLHKINIPNSVTRIGDNAFAKSGLESISLPYSIKYIGPYAFSNCKTLKIVNLRKTQISDIDGLFYGCEQLEDVYLSQEVKNIGFPTFYKCNSLKSITCYNSTPPQIDVSAFSEYLIPSNGEITDISKVILNVPEASIIVYKYSSVWKIFGEIKAIPMR